MKAKREPLLCDKFLAMPFDHRNDYSHQYWETTRANLQLSKRFVLDNEATSYCGQLIHDAPRVIADAQDFAIPPFERTYIEFPFIPWFRALTGREPDADGDTRIGYLIVKNVVRIIVEGPKVPGVPWSDIALMPLQYELHNPLPPAAVEFLEKIGASARDLDCFLWGESALKFIPGHMVTNNTFDLDEPYSSAITAKIPKDQSEWDMAGLRALRDNHGFRLMMNVKHADEMERIFAKLMRHSSGDLRSIIGLLLFLNRTSRMRYEREVPTVSQMYRTRQIPFLKHRVITMHVNPLPKLIRLAAGEGIRRRLHDVRGHLCHNEIARTNHHDHDWQESEVRDLQWFCECGGLRWWRHEHKRGHEEKGLVTSHYKVKE